MQGNMDLTAFGHVMAAKNGGNPLVSLLPIILIVVVFYFLLIRPQRRRQQQQLQLQRQLVPGQRVMTTSGMLATVTAVEDDAVVLEIAPGIETRFVKQAVGQVMSDTAGDDDEADDADEGEVEETGAQASDATTREDEPSREEDLPREDIEPKTEAKALTDDDRPESETVKDGEKRAGKKPSA